MDDKINIIPNNALMIRKEIKRSQDSMSFLAGASQRAKDANDTVQYERFRDGYEKASKRVKELQAKLKTIDIN